MRVNVHITFTDDTSEASMSALGVPRSALLTTYEKAFTELLKSVEDPRVKWDLLVVVDDNTEGG